MRTALDRVCTEFAVFKMKFKAVRIGVVMTPEYLSCCEFDGTDFHRHMKSGILRNGCPGQHDETAAFAVKVQIVSAVFFFPDGSGTGGGLF